MELHQLRYFVAVAETASFSQGARRSHVAQPSLSQQVAKLEQGPMSSMLDLMSSLDSTGAKLSLGGLGVGMLLTGTITLAGWRKRKRNAR